jgi:hypothetical protein
LIVTGSLDRCDHIPTRFTIASGFVVAIRARNSVDRLSLADTARLPTPIENFPEAFRRAISCYAFHHDRILQHGRHR